MKHHPRKRFSQNFLHDPAISNRIAAAISAQPNDYSVEIVPSPWEDEYVVAEGWKTSWPAKMSSVRI